MASSLPPSVLADPLWAHLAANWKPIPKRSGYALGVALSIAVVIVLPVLYVGLMAFLVLGSGWLLFRRVLSATSGEGVPFEGLLTLLLAIVALGTLFFLFKPLFAPSEEDSKSVQLKQFEELHLHSFVENVCAILGAPAPKRIDITCDVNAGAGFRGGLLGALFQTTPVLTIGLPLVAGMTKAQFAGVLAHEFGHFSQGAGMRATHLATRVVSWFIRAVYERDGWDLRLHLLSHSPEPWLRVLALLVRAGVFISRQLLKPIALLGWAMCTFTFRRMEYDADHHEVQFCGSAVFERSCATLEELGAASARAMAESRNMFARDRSLPNDLPACIAAYARRLTPEQRDQIVAERAAEKRSLLRTHPPTRERVAFARQLNLPGLFTDGSPARELFRDFDAASRKATRGEFAAMLGPYAIEARLVSLGDQLAASDRHAERVAVLPRYLGFDPPSWRPVFPTLRCVRNIEDPKPLAQRLRAARQELKKQAGAARERSEQYRKAAEELVKWEQVRSVMDANFRVDFKAMKLEPTTRAGVSHRIETLTNAAAAAADVIDRAGDAAMVRLDCSLTLLGVHGIERAVPDAAAMRTRADMLLPAAAVLREILPLAAHMRRLCGTIDVILLGVRNQQGFEESKKALRPLADEIRNRLDDARRVAGGTPDPFGSGESAANLGEAVVGSTPAWRDIEDIHHCGQLFVDRYTDWYRRVIGELVELAERTEKALAGGAKADPEVSMTDAGPRERPSAR